MWVGFKLPILAAPPKDQAAAFRGAQGRDAVPEVRTKWLLPITKIVLAETHTQTDRSIYIYACVYVCIYIYIYVYYILDVKVSSNNADKWDLMGFK